MNATIGFGLVLVLLGAPAPAALAGESAAPRVEVGLYGWLMDLEGHLVSPDGTAHEFTIPFAEIFERLEGVLQIVVGADAGRWRLLFDGTWARLGGGATRPVWQVDVDLRQNIYDLKLGYEILRSAGGTTLNAFAGARSYGATTTIVETNRGTGERRETVTEDGRWDALLGARGGFSLGRRWSVDVLGDLGGLGIGDSADFTWQLEANVAYGINATFAAFGGYRALSSRQESPRGGGNTVTQHGPRVGMSAAF